MEWAGCTRNLHHSNSLLKVGEGTVGMGSPSSHRTLPPPPWEVQESNQQVGMNSQPMQVTQLVVTHSQPVQNGAPPQFMGNNDVMGMFIRPITVGQLPGIHYQQPGEVMGFHPQPQGGQMMGMPNSPASIHSHPMGGQYPVAQFLEQRMHSLSMQDDSGLENSYSSTSNPLIRKSKPEDKLFGDLVLMAKVKPKDG